MDYNDVIDGKNCDGILDVYGIATVMEANHDEHNIQAIIYTQAIKNPFMSASVI